MGSHWFDHKENHRYDMATSLLYHTLPAHSKCTLFYRDVEMYGISIGHASACRWFLLCHETTKDNENAKLRLNTSNFTQTRLSCNTFFFASIFISFHSCFECLVICPFVAFKMFTVEMFESSSPRTFLK